MATTPAECPNYHVNEQQCPRDDRDSPHWGICCECIRAHVSKGTNPLCMSGIARPVETRSLPIGESPDCGNRKRNNDVCACYETSCSRRGLCCDCIRFHWGHNIWPKVACVK